SLCYPPADRSEQLGIVNRLQESEGISAADEDGLSQIDGVRRIRDLMDRLKVIAHRFEALASQRGISIAIVQREWDEEDAFKPSKEIPDFDFSVIQITAPMQR